MGRMGALDWDNLMAQPRITVLMPVWNGEAYLSQALASILRQTHDDFELLVVDDGSTDRTAEILTACHDSRLRVLRNETRRKLSGALNRGIAEARGEFIARMDADDLMRPDRLARQVACLERNSDWICCGGAVRTLGCGSGTILRYPCEPAELPAFCLFYAPFAHPTVMFRREWFQRAGLAYDGAYYPAEDYELWTRILRQFPAGNLPQVLLEYRVHGQSMTGGEWSAMDEQTIRVQEQLLRRLGMSPTAEQLRLHRAASLGRLPPSEESIEQAADWLQQLAASNRETRQYPPERLASMLNYVWFRQTMAVVRAMGQTAWVLYRQSPLAFMGPEAAKHRWLVRLAALKAQFFPKPL